MALGSANNHFPGLLAEEQDAAALKTELDAAIAEMNQFAYIVSHDLQAPLRMVTGFLELLVKRYEDKLDEQAKQYIGYAIKGTEKMKRLIFDLLEYSRVSTTDEAFEEVDLNEVFLELAEKMNTVLREAGVRLFTGQLPVVRGRHKQLLQLFSQLVDNAVKFNNAAPEITVSAERTGTAWKISVTDNGIGIDPAFFDKIFLVFRRLYADEEKYKGTGIGLAICKKIAERHGGTIGLEATPGAGSTFWITIPVA